MDTGHPFPFISNLSRSLGISFKKPKGGDEVFFARIKIPQNIPQWIALGEVGKNNRFVHIDDLITSSIGDLLRGMKILKTMIFRITRSAIYDTHEEEQGDMLDMIEEGIRERKFAMAVRLEHDKNSDPWILDFISQQIAIPPERYFLLESLKSATNFHEIISLPFSQLKYSHWRRSIPLDFAGDNEDGSPLSSLFEMIQRKDLLVHHPYESFGNSVQEFVRQASIDPDVMAIKMTLYRTDPKGALIDSLVQAAENGKQVVVVIELKARFDEAKNIYWAQKLENVGIHVTYGLLKKKTHSKLAMVIRKESPHIRSYVHIGTGNYNLQTSRFLRRPESFYLSKRDL